MVLPPGLMERYRKNCGFYSTTVPKIQQEVLRCFIEEGHFERHLNKMRGIYRTKHDFLLNLLKQYPWVKKVSGDHAGLHVLVQVDSRLGEQELCRMAGERGMRVYGLSEYLVGEAEWGQRDAVLLLGYGRLSEEDMVQGLSILNDILMKGER